MKIRQIASKPATRMLGISFILIAIMGIVNSCYYDSREELYPTLNNSCDTSNVLFSTSVTEVLQTNCLGCHNNSMAANEGGGVFLQDYADVKAVAEDGRLMSVVNQTGYYSPMPKNGSKIDNCSILILQKWIDNGFPQ